MSGVNTYSVTMVRPTYGLPSFEVGAYEYVGDRLPYVGETIEVGDLEFEVLEVERRRIAKVRVRRRERAGGEVEA